MPSRFDIITGKIPVATPAEDDKKLNSQLDSHQRITRPRRNNDRQVVREAERSFLDHLKLVNETTGAEIRLSGGDFNLSVATSTSGVLATLNISVNCPIEDAQRLLQRIHVS